MKGILLAPRQSSRPSYSLPWMVLVRLTYLSGGACWVLFAGGWDFERALATLVPVLPVLLHLTLLVPRRQPVAVEHPYIFRWIYGIPALAIVVPVLLLIVSPTMGGHLGYRLGFELRAAFKQSPALSQATMAIACFWLAYLPLTEFGKAARVKGRRAVIERPITLIFALLCVPISGGLAITFASLALGLPGTIPDVARMIAETLLQAAWLSAKFATFFVFPAAIGLAAFRSFRTLPWQNS